MRNVCRSLFVRGVALLVMSAVLGGATARQALAQDDAPALEALAEAPPTIPDTPAGGQLGWFLGALAETNPPSGDEIEARFTPEFLAQVPTTQMIATTKGLRMQLGSLRLRAIDERSPTHLVATLFSPKLDTSFSLQIVTMDDEAHKIDTLLVRALPRQVAEGETWDAIDESFAQVGADVAIGAYRVRDNGTLTPVHMLNERTPLAMGSAFKLWVLAALSDAVRAGRLRFDDTLGVRDAWKSLPSGTIQNDPAGTEHTLAHYANQMISISDNTAADHLIHTVGREEVEAAMARWCDEPARNRPFLTTRDLFALKLSSDESIAPRYIAGDETARRKMLEEETPTMTPNLAMASFWVAPRMIDTIEWYGSAEDLCETISALARTGSQEEAMAPVMQALSINPGVALDRALWPGFAYKGGSEPGVMNMTYWLLRKDGKRFALSVFVNDPIKNFEQTEMVPIVERAIGMLSKE